MSGPRFIASATWRALLLALATLAPVSSVELRDAELVAGGHPALENAAGTVRLEGARVGRVGPTVYVPEPDARWLLGAGTASLVLLARRRRAGSGERG